MSVADDMLMGPIFPATTPACPVSPAGDKSLEADEPVVRHRLAEVRQQQGISVRSASRRMGVPMEQVRREEKPETNLTLSDLQALAASALEVPMADLLVDHDSPLSMPVVTRARWLRLMKTVKALIELDASASATRMAQMLEHQVLEVMPELKDVGAWHSVGQRRTQDEVGRIAEQSVPVNFARDGLQ